VPSNSKREWFIQSHYFHPEKLVTIYNGVNVVRFNPDNKPSIDIRKKYGISIDKSIITHIAYLIPEKGVEYVMRAARKVIDMQPNVHFIFVGDGPLSSYLHELANELNIKSNITITGLIEDEEMKSIAIETAIYTLASIWREAFSLVILEGMAMAKPIVATNVGGAPEAVIDGQTGILVPPADDNALARAYINLLQNRELATKMGKEGRLRVEKDFNIKRWINDTICLYRDT